MINKQLDYLRLSQDHKSNEMKRRSCLGAPSKNFIKIGSTLKLIQFIGYKMATTIEDFMKAASDEQKELLFKLSETVEQEQKYAEEVNRIYGSMRSGIYSLDGISVTLCEDEDDARVISFKPRQELQRVREQMKDYMKKAVELNMAHLGIIQRNYEHYVGEPLKTE